MHDMKEKKVAIVIPFFQRKEGILLHSVNSVFEQKNLSSFKIFVVDDDSPVKASVELKNIIEKNPDNIVILEQPNGGPGAARNKGITVAHQNGFDYIAFLDSDDEWQPLHIDTALKALGNDYDFYFCDTIHRDGKSSVFESKNFPVNDFENCLALNKDNIFEYKGDLFRLILESRCPIHTSAVVYRSASYDLLFRTDLRTAGEDYFFWLQVANQRKKIVFSTKRLVRLNYGMNLYVSVKWGTNAKLQQILDNWRYWFELPRFFDMTKEYTLLRYKTQKEQKKEFMDNFIHMLLHGKKINWSIVKEYISSYPQFPFLVPFGILNRIIKRIFVK